MTDLFVATIVRALNTIINQEKAPKLWRRLRLLCVKCWRPSTLEHEGRRIVWI